MLKRISIIDAANLLFWLIMMILLGLTFDTTPYKIELLTAYPLLLLFFFFMVKTRNIYKSERLNTLLNFLLPVLFFFLIFETIFMILPYFSSARWDAALHRWDLALLGVNPTLWFEQYTNPFFTEILYIAYFLYFPMPLVVFGRMIRKKQYTAIEKYLFIFLVTYYISYIIYFFVPAMGPRYFLASQYSIPLKGLWLSEPIRNFIDTLEPNKLDAFPSLHTAILFTTLILAYKNDKTLFYIYVPIGVLILISVIYCRYHYFVDVIAGIIVSFASYGLAYKLYYRYGSKFTFHFGDKKA